MKTKNVEIKENAPATVHPESHVLEHLTAFPPALSQYTLYALRSTTFYRIIITHNFFKHMCSIMKTT